MAATLPERSLLDAFTRPADQRQLALAIPVVVILTALFAVAAPFASVKMQPLPAFVPIYQSVLIVNDLITAAFMFGQAQVSRSRPLLVLATGYAFTAFAAIAHLLTFPGLFSPTGLLGAGEQTTAWLYMFWHAGFPLFVIGYTAIARRSSSEANVSQPLIAACIAAAFAMVCAFVLLATARAGLLPPIMKGNHYAPGFSAAISSVVALIVIAGTALWARRPRTVLDLWLLVVLCAWLFDVLISAVLNAGRFDLGFYLGRIYGLLAASFVLGVLIIEHLKVYADLVRANAMARRHTAEMMAVAGEKAAREEKERADTEATRILGESDERFRALADNIAQLAWMADESGFIFWYNQRWYEYTGTTFEEMKGWGWQSVHDPEHLPRVIDKFRRHVAAAEPWEDTFPLRARDGSFGWFLSRAVPILGEDGRVHLWFGTNTDVTEQRLAQEALSKADRMKNAFIATLAHELRNPLAPILNSVQILRLTKNMPREGGRPIEIIDNQVHHLVRLVDDLLDLSRITLGKITLRRESLDLREVIQEAVEASRPVLQASRHALTVDVADVPLTVEGDRVRLSQVLSNLLNNAARYTPRNGTLALAAAIEAQEVVITVEDNGVGIAPEMLARIFDAFVQVEHGPERMRSGLGIGLSLVENLVKLHGGSVSAHSAGLGLGSRFTVRLPHLMHTLQEDANDASDEMLLPVRRINILVVDDNEDAATTQQILLSSLGHEAHCALGGPAALRLALQFRPEVVLLDLGMPGMDGYEVARRLRELPETRDAVIIAQTGWGQAEDRALTHAAGFDAHLTKPVDIERVLQVALQCLDQRDGTAAEVPSETGG